MQSRKLELFYSILVTLNTKICCETFLRNLFCLIFELQNFLTFLNDNNEFLLKKSKEFLGYLDFDLWQFVTVVSLSLLAKTVLRVISIIVV